VEHQQRQRKAACRHEQQEPGEPHPASRTGWGYDRIAILHRCHRPPDSSCGLSYPRDECRASRTQARYLVRAGAGLAAPFALRDVRGRRRAGPRVD
jgi:hypothetical protein